jgi:hypothetical protein
LSIGNVMLASHFVGRTGEQTVLPVRDHIEGGATAEATVATPRPPCTEAP